ncbi:response regulator [Candidatus Poribacteria bacterium]|nr:response regulator [Candidatus Poribacteria bacterium]
MKEGRAVVLIVDDDINSLDVIMQNLQRAGYEAVPAVDGRTAMEIVRQGVVDLAVVDYNLPDMNGLQVLKVIKGIMPGIPVIIMSASEMNHNNLLDLLEAGAYAFVPKPICVPDFIRTIGRALSTSGRSTPQSSLRSSILVRWTSWIIRRG